MLPESSLLARARNAGLLSGQIWFVPALLGVLLTAAAFHDTLLFQTLARLLVVGLAFALFAVAWQTRLFCEDRLFSVLACGFFWSGALTFLHALSTPGLPFFADAGGALSSRFWIALRGYDALLFLLTPLIAARAWRPATLLAGSGLVAGILVLTIVRSPFPSPAVEILTAIPLSLAWDFLVVAALVAAVVVVFRNDKVIGGTGAPLLIIAIVLRIGAETAFALPSHMVDPSNFAGHVLKVLSFWILFQAFIAANLQKPYIALQTARAEAARSRDEADEANRAKADFLSRMSHNLRTPLNAILGFTDVMHKQTFGPIENPRYQSYLTIVLKSGNQLVHLIDNLLDLGKIESGSYVLREELMDMEDVARGVAICSENGAVLEKNRLVYSFPIKAPKLFGDRRAVASVMENLISNALAFSDDTAPIYVSWVPGENGQWVFSVRHEGHGMDARAIATIGEPFIRDDPHVAASRPGDATGLHVVKVLVGLHDGRLDMESVVDKGMKVSIAFPKYRVIWTADA